MVERDVVLRKCAAIEHHASRLRAKRPLAAGALESDESLRNDVCFDLLQAIQATIDLAVHACTHEALGAPETPAAAFELLARRGILMSSLAARLSQAVGPRNLIVHRYADIHAGKLAAAVDAGLGDFDEFSAALQNHASRNG